MNLILGINFNKGRFMKSHYIKVILLAIALLIKISSAFGQVVGNPGSSQSAVQVCVPASYQITYTFEFIVPANPTAS